MWLRVVSAYMSEVRIAMCWTTFSKPAVKTSVCEGLNPTRIGNCRYLGATWTDALQFREALHLPALNVDKRDSLLMLLSADCGRGGIR